MRRRRGDFSLMSVSGVAGLVAAAVGVAGGEVASAQTVAQRVLAVSGQAAPGTEEGTVFDGVGLPGIGARGDVAFYANLIGAPGNPDSQESLWLVPSAASGSSPTLAHLGPISAGQYIGNAIAPFVDAAGRVALTASVGTSGTAVLVGTPGNYRTVATSFDPAPGMPAGTVLNGHWDQPVLDGAGDVYIEAGTSPARSGIAAPLASFVSTGGGAPQVVAYQGGPVPGMPDATVLNFSHAALAAGGRVAFAATAKPSTATDPRQFVNGIWSGVAGDLTRVAYAGMTAPGLAAGVRMDRFPTAPGVNSSGVTAFTCFPVTAAGIALGPVAYLYEDGQLTLMAGSGTPVPAVGEGYTMGYATTARVTGRGEALLHGSTRGPSAGATSVAGWYRWRAGVVTPIVQDGRAAPQIGAGVTLTKTTVISFNEAGEALVRAVLAGPGVDSTNSDSLWAVDPLGQFSLVARTGSVVGVGDGERVVSKFDVVTTFYETNGWNEFLVPPALGDSGQVAYHVTFTDGSSANLLATLPAVIAGDANNDLTVDEADFWALYGHLGQAGDRTAGDLDGDGRVSFADYQLLERNFGRSIDGGAVTGVPGDLAALVPEPGGLEVFGVVVMMVIGARRRRGGSAR